MAAVLAREEVVLRIRLARVFVLRIWVGVRLLHMAIWVLGGRAEVPSE
jgi:hypothetical protein